MISNFFNKATEDIYNGIDSREARDLLPQELLPLAQHRLDVLNIVKELYDLKSLPVHNLRILPGKRKGQYSIRIEGSYHICFSWYCLDGRVKDVEITEDMDEGES